MAFGNFDREDDNQPMAEINVTPLVDVMLVLLIVFMITMPVLTHSIPLELPVSTDNTPSSPVPQNKLVRLAVNVQGDYFLDDKKVANNELQSVLLQHYQDNPNVILAISADKSVAYENVTNALQIAKQAGIGRIAFETEINPKKGQEICQTR